MSNKRERNNDNERARTSLTIVTCNINGMTIDKVTDIYENIAAELDDGDRADMIFLQETKMEARHATNLKNSLLNNCGYHLHHNHVFSKSNEYKQKVIVCLLDKVLLYLKETFNPCLGMWRED